MNAVQMPTWTHKKLAVQMNIIGVNKLTASSNCNKIVNITLACINTEKKYKSIKSKKSNYNYVVLCLN